MIDQYSFRSIFNRKEVIASLHPFSRVCLFLFLFLFFWSGIGFLALASQTGNGYDDIRQRQEQAVQLAKDGKYKQSLAILKELQTEFPYNRLILYDYTVILSWAGEYKTVLEQEKDIDLSKAPVFVLNAIAGAHQHLRQFDRAITVYRRILSLDSVYLPATIGIAFCLAEKGDVDAGLAMLEQEEKKQPNNPERMVELLSARAQIHHRQNDAEKENECYQRILELDPGNREVAEKQLQVKVSQLTRNGEYDKAIALYEKLMVENPGNQKLFYDYLVTLSWAGKHQQVVDATDKLSVDTAPRYVLEAVAKSYRNNGQLDKAIGLYEKILMQDPIYLSAIIGKALCVAEKGNTKQAMLILKKEEKKQPRHIELLFGIAYIYHLDKAFFDEMRYYQKILDIDPVNKPAKRAYIVLVSLLGAPNISLEILGKEKDLQLEPQSFEQIMGDRAAQWVKWGELTPPNEWRRFTETDKAIKVLTGNVERNRQGEEPYRLRYLDRARFDRLVAYRDRVMMKEAVEEYEKLVEEEKTLPFYALIAVGDAYLYLEKPRKALNTYREALKLKPNDFNARHSLFYALLECEKYKQAIKTIDKLARREPTWYRSPNSRVYAINSWKLSAEITSLLARAYSRKLRVANRKLYEIFSLAPYNQDLRIEAAKTGLWREWRRYALRYFRLVLAYRPKNLGARIWINQTLAELNRFKGVDDNIETLLKIYPENKGVQKLKRDWDTRHRLHYYAELMGGKGEGIVMGTKEFSIDQYLYAPPVNHGYKFYLHHRYNSTRFLEGSPKYNLFGIGVAYSHYDLSGNLEVTRTHYDSENHYGLIVNTNWDIDDHWRISGGLDTNIAEIPAKGRLVDLRGRSAAAALTYRYDDSRYFSGMFKVYDFNDGNRRTAFGLTAFQQLYIGPFWRFALTGSLYHSSNTGRDRVYYNPEEDLSYGLTFETWHHLYRRYDFKFVHRLILDYGNYWQQNFGSDYTLVIRYEHHWDIDDRRAFLYGISWARRVYDGNPENATTYYATINWRF